MKRRMVLGQLAVIGLVSIAIILYTVFDLLQLHLVNRPFTVTVQLHSAGGIFKDAEVAYRGVQVGRVSAVDLHTDGVTLTAKIDSGTKIPDNAIAHVYDLSAVGEQYLDLVPARSSTTYLHGGSVIPVSRTTEPPETATVLYDLERLVDSVNPQDVQIIGREGAAAFAGTGPQLKSILANSIILVDQLAASEGHALHLLGNANTLLHGAATHSGEFAKFATSLNSLSSTLASSTPTINTFLQQAPATTQLVNNLIENNASAISVLLGNLATLSDIQVVRIPGLESLLVAVPEFGRLAPSLVRDGSLQAAAKLNLTEPVCTTGVPLTSPISGIRTPLKSVSCNRKFIARGAGNAPGATGATRSAAAGAAAQDSGAPNASNGAVELGSYDPSTGLTRTSAGSMIRLGANGGDYGLPAADSWEALLLAGTGGSWSSQ
jgi:phospholipid/cholesterol/gamma-HCH transport system substrate-binding protein